MKIRFGVILFLIFVASAQVSLACMKTETGAPVCAYWTRADVAFLGKAVKVENAPRSEDLAEGARKIRFQVLENYKGADNPTFTVVVKPDCGANIKSGQTWIVYASSDIVLKTFSAFRAARVEPKIPNAEAETLKNIFAGNSETAVAGRFVSAAQNSYAFEPVEITVTGGGKLFTAKSDADGEFNVAVPDGNYKIELKFPYKANLKWDENLLGASLTEGIPTVFKYDVRLNDGDCHFALFEVLNR